MDEDSFHDIGAVNHMVQLDWKGGKQWISLGKSVEEQQVLQDELVEKVGPGWDSPLIYDVIVQWWFWW